MKKIIKKKKDFLEVWRILIIVDSVYGLHMKIL